MSAFKRLAAWLDPEAAEAREESKNALLNAQDAINEMSAKIGELSKANDNLINSATAAGLRANVRGEALKTLLVETATARSYAIDHIDEIDEQIAKTTSKSKKRAELEAVRAAIAADVVRLNLAIENASKVLP